MRVLLNNDSGSHAPYDIAVDPYSRSLYWTDSMNNSVSAGELLSAVFSSDLSFFYIVADVVCFSVPSDRHMTLALNR